MLSKDLADALASRLRAAHYDEPTISARLDIPDISDIQAAHLPHYLGIRLHDEPLDVLIRIFLLGRPVARQEAERALGRDIVDGLEACHVLQEDSTVRCPYSLFPCLGRLLLTDALITREYHRHYVMPLGGDSYALARAIVPTEGRVLDVCTGSGVQAIVAAAGAGEVIAVDVNPRALEFVAFNARLNRLDNVATRLGSVYTAVPGERFMRILANPPFVPTPETLTLPLYRGGGESGEDVLGPLIEQLGDHLDPLGMAQIYTVMVSGRDRPFTAKISHWLGDMPHGALLTLFSKRDPETFALNHLLEMEDAWDMASFQTKLQLWIDSFKRQEFEVITEGVIHIQRRPNGVEPWVYERLLTRPSVRYADRIARFFAACATLQDPAAMEAWRPRLAPNVRAVWQGWDADGQTRHAVTFQRDDWNSDRELTPQQFDLLRRCRGEETAAALIGAHQEVKDTLTQLVAVECVS